MRANRRRFQAKKKREIQKRLSRGTIWQKTENGAYIPTGKYQETNFSKIGAWVNSNRTHKVDRNLEGIKGERLYEKKAPKIQEWD